MFQDSFKGVSKRFQGCFKVVSRKFQGCFEGVLRVFQGSFNGVIFSQCTLFQITVPLSYVLELAVSDS